jgi:hypothetical protein
MASSKIIIIKNTLATCSRSKDQAEALMKLPSSYRANTGPEQEFSKNT